MIVLYRAATGTPLAVTESAPIQQRQRHSARMQVAATAASRRLAKFKDLATVRETVLVDGCAHTNPDMDARHKLLRTSTSSGQQCMHRRMRPCGSAGSCGKSRHHSILSSTKLGGSCGRFSSTSQRLHWSTETAVALRLLGSAANAPQWTQRSWRSVVGSCGSACSLLRPGCSRGSPTSSCCRFGGSSGSSSMCSLKMHRLVKLLQQRDDAAGNGEQQQRHQGA